MQSCIYSRGFGPDTNFSFPDSTSVRRAATQSGMSGEPGHAAVGIRYHPCAGRQCPGHDEFTPVAGTNMPGHYSGYPNHQGKHPICNADSTAAKRAYTAISMASPAMR